MTSVTAQTAAPVVVAATGTPDAVSATEQPIQDTVETRVTLWVADAIVPVEQSPGRQAFEDQLVTFGQAHPDIHVELQVKHLHGAGGILAYLRSAPPVAPGSLPDLVLLDRDALVEAARAALIEPLPPFTDPALLADLYPVAQQIGQVDGTAVGLSYLLEVDQAVYRRRIYRAAPETFRAVLDQRRPFALPIGTSGRVSATLLLQYMAAGGVLTDDKGAPHLDEEALTQVLNFYAQARSFGLFDSALLPLDIRGDWLLYRDGKINLAATTSTLYLAESAQAQPDGLAVVPRSGDRPLALARGWAWALVTRDARQQAAAMALLGFLMDPINQGAYSQSIGWLPSQDAALAVWRATPDAYPAFARRLLAGAQPLPDAAARSTSGAAIQQAAESVLLKNMSPKQAVSMALNLVP